MEGEMDGWQTDGCMGFPLQRDGCRLGGAVDVLDSQLWFSLINDAVLRGKPSNKGPLTHASLRSPWALSVLTNTRSTHVVGVPLTLLTALLHLPVIVLPF